ncbi:MAG: UbiA family prenyltransferase [Candidatus Marsarchaeota archaeon]|nr:UbiA family prenyltransferase [Candidatus Marsarchaeota archaeon]
MPISESIKQILKLTRIEHSIMLIIAVLSSEIIVLKRVPSLALLLLSLVAPIFISMSAFAINDYFDVETDRANKKNRPIVTGAITTRMALNVSIGCLAIGIAGAAFINAGAFAIAVVFGAVSMLYSYKLKDVFLAGNVFVALSMAIPFIYGNYVVSGTISSNILLISTLILFAGIAREVHGTIRDYDGDMLVRKTRNIVSAVGRAQASVFAFLLYAVAIGISIYLFLFNPPFMLNAVYLALILVVDALLIYVNVVYIKINITKRKLGNAAKARKYDLMRNIGLGAMALALIAFIASTLIYFPI